MKRESSLMPMNFLSASSWVSTCWTWEVEQELGTLFIFHLTGSTQRKKGNTVRVIKVDMTRHLAFKRITLGVACFVFCPLSYSVGISKLISSWCKYKETGKPNPEIN